MLHLTPLHFTFGIATWISHGWQKEVSPLAPDGIRIIISVSQDTRNNVSLKICKSCILWIIAYPGWIYDDIGTVTPKSVPLKSIRPDHWPILAENFAKIGPQHEGLHGPGADSISCSAEQDFLGKCALLNTFSGAQIFLRHRNNFSWKLVPELVPDQNLPDFHRNKISATDPLNVTPCGCVYHFERSTSRKCEMSRVKLILATLLFCWSIRVEAENADSPKCSSKPKKADLSKTSPS